MNLKHILSLAALLLLPTAAWSITYSGYIRNIGPSGACNVSGSPVDLSHLASLTIVRAGTSTTYALHLPLTHLRRGEFVTATGRRNKKTGILQARTLLVNQPTAKQQISGTAVIDRLPQLQPKNSAYTGTIYADGYILHVTPATKITLPAGDSLTAPNWITYSATLQPGNTYLATALTFTPDHPGPKDVHFKKKTDHHFRPGKCPTGALVVVRLFRACFATVPNAQVQAYVTAIGNSLIPQWQRNLPATDPAKIHFHFYVVERNRRLGYIASNDAGTVIIPTNVLLKLQNKAQLAALLSADVAVAITQHYFRTRIERRTASGAILASELAMDTVVPFGGLIPMFAGGTAYDRAAYIPQVESHYRIGLRYLARAHYDVYQAPIAIQRVSEHHPNRDHSTHEPTGAQYIEKLLAIFYPTYDSAHAQTAAKSYAKFLTQVRAGAPKIHHR